METKTELLQSFELLEMKNKSKLLQKYIHALQMNLQFIVTLVEGLSALKQSCMNAKKNCDIIKNRNICLPIYRG